LRLAEAEVFRSWDFFFAVVSGPFRGLVESVERRADFLAGVDAGFVFRFVMGKEPLSRFTRDLGPVGGPGTGMTGLRLPNAAVLPRDWLFCLAPIVGWAIVGLVYPALPGDEE
jgi:hypothetical protein